MVSLYNLFLRVDIMERRRGAEYLLQKLITHLAKVGEREVVREEML